MTKTFSMDVAYPYFLSLLSNFSQNGLTPTELALSWCYHRNIVASTIIGATTMDQLHENIKSYDIKLNDDTLEEIGKVYKKYTDPTKAYGA